MDIKKNPKADLEKSKTTFFQLGLAIAIALLLIAFEWTTVERQESAFAAPIEEAIEEELIPQTEQEEIQPEAPPEVNVTDIFEIVDNEVQVDDQVVFFDDRMTFDEEIAMRTSEVTREEEEEEEEAFIIVEHMPTFRGSDVNEFNRWVQDRIVYPPLAIEGSLQGRVMVSFVVEADGTVSNVEVVRGVHPVLDQEAVRVVSSSPAWSPGRQRERPVRVRFTIPVNFTLR